MQRTEIDRDRQVVLTETEARQGINSGMYRVLAISMTLAVIAGVILYFVISPMRQPG